MTGYVGAEIYMLYSKTYFCIVNNHSQFPVVKQIDGLSDDSLFKICKFLFAEYDLPRKKCLMLSQNLFQRCSGNLQMPEYTLGYIIIIQPSEQWTKRGMHKVCTTHHEEMFWN